MAVGICHEHLNRSVRSSFGIVDELMSLLLQYVGRRAGVIDFKSEVVIATAFLQHGRRKPGRATAIMFFDQVYQGGTRLKPGSFEVKCRTRDFGHSQQIDIESAAGVDVTNNQGDVVDMSDLNWWMVVGH